MAKKKASLIPQPDDLLFGELAATCQTTAKLRPKRERLMVSRLTFVYRVHVMFTLIESAVRQQHPERLPGGAKIALVVNTCADKQLLQTRMRSAILRELERRQKHEKSATKSAKPVCTAHACSESYLPGFAD